LNLSLIGGLTLASRGLSAHGRRSPSRTVSFGSIKNLICPLPFTGLRVFARSVSLTADIVIVFY
jgi:hypothetical protein